ncbi:MAG: type II secretion system F family protein [bacterium]
MKFQYKIQTNTGKIEAGFIEAPDRNTALKQLKDQNAVVISLSEKKGKSFNISFSFGGTSLEDRIQFTKNLGGMLGAGLSLARALEILEKQAIKPIWKKVLASLIADINAGATLSDAMKKFPKIFSPLFISMTKAGEESGGMVDALSQVGLAMEKTYALNKKVKSALMYPSIILSAVVLIGILMMIFVVPTITKTFKDLGVALPKTTKMIIVTSDFFSHHPFIIFGLLIIIVVGIMGLLRIGAVSRFLDKFILKIPVVGTIAQEANTARISRTISSLLIAGVDMLRAISIARDVVSNTVYKKILDEAIEKVQKGGLLSETFKKYPKVCPVMMGEMISVGEETGKLSGMLLDVATFYEEAVDIKTKDLSTIIEPVLMIFIGAAVGFFAVSMLSPMYSLVDSLSK